MKDVWFVLRAIVLIFLVAICLNYLGQKMLKQLIENNKMYDK